MSVREENRPGGRYLLKGIALDTEYVTLSVFSEQANTVNYATSVLKVEKGGQGMEGKLVGRARSLDGVVVGDLVFRKIP